MSVLKTQYSTAEIIVIMFGAFLLVFLAEFLGWGSIFIAGAVILFCLLIFYLSWTFKIRTVVVVEDKTKTTTDIDTQMDKQLLRRLEKTTNYFLVLLAIVVFIIIPSLLLIIFQFGSVFIAGMAIIAISLLCTGILVLFPWPSWMRKCISVSR
jgi:MFS family permease